MIEGPATLAVEDHGIESLIIVASDKECVDDQVEAAIDWTAQNYPPICLGVFTIPTICN